MEEAPPKDTADDGEKKAVEHDVEKKPVEDEISSDGSNVSLEEHEEIKPNRFTDERGNLLVVNFAVRHSCPVFLGILFMNILMTVILFVVLGNDEGSGTSTTNYGYELKHKTSVAYDSLRLGNELVVADRTANGGSEVVVTQSQTLDATTLVWESEEDDGLFGSGKSIKAMKSNLDILLDAKDKDTYCQINIRSSNCRAPLNNLKVYYPSSWNASDMETVNEVIGELSEPGAIEEFNKVAACNRQASLCTDETEDDKDLNVALNNKIESITNKWNAFGELISDDFLDGVTTFAAYLAKLDSKKQLVDYGFDTSFGLDSNNENINLVSKYSRATVFWGSPLDVDGTYYDKDEDAIKELTEYAIDNLYDDLQDITNKGDSGSIDSYYIFGALIGKAINDLLASDGMLASISFLFIFLYLYYVIGSWFLAIAGMCEIFFALPVGWFVFRCIFQIKYFAQMNYLVLFMVAAIGADDIFIFVDAYHASAREGYPDLETRMSAVFRHTGTAMGITSMTTCFSFISLLLTPLIDTRSFGIYAAIVIFCDYVFVMTLFCSGIIIYHNKYEDEHRKWYQCYNPIAGKCKNQDPSPTAIALEEFENATNHVVKADPISRFFTGKVAPTLKDWKRRGVIGSAFIVWVGIAIAFVAQLERNPSTDQFLPDDNQLQVASVLVKDEFPQASDTDGLSIYFTVGLDDVNRKGVNQFDNADFVGVGDLDEDFKFNEECQDKLLEACIDLKYSNEYRSDIKQNELGGLVSCFILELGAYNVLGEKGDDVTCEVVESLSWRTNNTWQVPEDELKTVMQGFLQETSCYGNGETVLSFYDYGLGWDGEKMKYAGMSIQSNVVAEGQNPGPEALEDLYDDMIDIRDHVGKIISSGNSCGVNDVVMTDLDQMFVYMNTSSVYIKGMVSSIRLGLVLAFAVILSTTKVFHIALMATIAILCVVLSVMGVMIMLGWKVGAIEAILISVVTGFSVDYMVHLAHAYKHKHGTPYKRVKAALGEMGISVLNGMITSVGASIPLFFCSITFFEKFGIFLCLTILFSWLFANFGFTSLLIQLNIPLKERKGGFMW